MMSPHKLLSVTALLIVLLSLGLARPAAAESPRDLEQAEDRFQEAREALNRSRYTEAAELFAQAYELSRPAMAAGDALYWEAFALARLERTANLKRAAELLRLQQAEFAAAATAREGEALAARIYAQLAERGEAEAAREVAEQARQESLRQETRTAALQALMQMDPRKAMPVLEKIIRDDSPENRDLRRNAVFIMCHEGGKEAEDLLIDLLQTEGDPEFVSDIVMCLSMTGSDRSMRALMDLFNQSKDPRVSEAALISIGRHGGDEVFDFLVKIARDGSRDTEMRAQALMALGMTGRDGKVAEVMIQVLETETDPQILEMAMFSLGSLDTPASQEAITIILNRPEADEELKAMALHFAARKGSVNPATLHDLYRNAESRELKRQVCHVLAMMDDEDQALDMLIEITRTETDPEIKRDAVFWIGQFDNERAAQYLLEVINED